MIVPPDWVREAPVEFSPGMCGSLFLFTSTWGDWVWDAVSARFNRSVHRVYDHEGCRLYLSFSFMELKTSGGWSPSALDFGDRAELRSAVLADPPYGTLTRHVLTASEAGGSSSPGGRMALTSYNRWIRRGSGSDNGALIAGAVPGLEEIPTVPQAESPRRVLREVRRSGGYPVREAGEDASEDGVFGGVAQADLSVDINAAGLIYFAAMWRMSDRATMACLEEFGVVRAELLPAAVREARLAIFSNFNADDELSWRGWVSERAAREGRRFRVAVTFHHRAAARLLFSAEFLIDVL